MRVSVEPPPSEQEEPTLAFTLLDSLPAGVLLYDGSGAIRFANERACAILDIDGSDVTKASVTELLDSMPHEMETTAVEGGIVIAQLGGRTRQLGFRVTKLEVGTAPVYLALFQDITQRETQKREKQRRLLLSSVSHLLPAMAHEIKNPLAAIQSVVEVLLQDIHDDAQRRDLHVVLEEVGRMAFLVDRMGLVNERLVTGSRQSDMAAAVRRSIALAERRAASASVTLRFEGPEERWEPIHPELLLTILGNLINNALDASAPGQSIRVSVGEADDAFELSVKDSGSGMTPHDLERATEPFYSTKGSSGIGLALIRDIVERAGGSLTISSEEGAGTTVSIRVKRGET